MSSDEDEQFDDLAGTGKLGINITWPTGLDHKSLRLTFKRTDVEYVYCSAYYTADDELRSRGWTWPFLFADFAATQIGDDREPAKAMYDTFWFIVHHAKEHPQAITPIADSNVRDLGDGYPRLVLEQLLISYK